MVDIVAILREVQYFEHSQQKHLTFVDKGVIKIVPDPLRGEYGGGPKIGQNLNGP